MRITESMIRRIIKEEANRAINEQMDERMDPVTVLEMGMTHIEDAVRGEDDPRAARIEAEGMIDDICSELKESLHDWLDDYIKDNEQDRAEYERDTEYDREMHRGEDNDR